MKEHSLALNLTWYTQVLKKWDQFWFESDNPLALALVRICLGTSMFLTYLSRFFELSYFSADGVITSTFIKTVVQPTLNIPFYKVFESSLSPLVLQIIFMTLLLFFILGFLNRVGVFALWFLHLSFLYQNPAIIFGADFVSATFLFYLIFANTKRKFSIFKSKNSSSDVLSSVALRLIQIQMSLLYAFTGFEKFKGGTWWDGTALWHVFANPQFTLFDFTWLRHFPLFIVFIGIMTLIFEVYFPVMIYSEKFKKIWLVMGLLFHLGITALLGLYSFSFVMISIYWAFLKEAEIKKLLPWLKAN